MREKEIMLITFIGVVVLIFVLFGFISVILSMHRRKQHAFLQQLEDIKNKFEREALKSQLEVQEQTLKHISRDLHDNIGHYITLAKLHLNSIEVKLGNEGGHAIAYAIDLLTKSLDDMRDLSRSLSLELIHTAGLPMAMEKQVEQLRMASHYDIHFQVNGDYHFLDEEKEIILFRILQEAINNIIRHAKAKTIDIALTCSPNSVVLLVKDDGKGFHIERLTGAANTDKHTGGLRNMRARAALINADFEIESEVGSGTQLRVSVPFNKTNNLTDG